MKKRKYKIMMLACLMPAVCLLLSGCQNNDNSTSRKVSAVSEVPKRILGGVQNKYLLNLGEVRELDVAEEEVISFQCNKPEVVSVSEAGVMHALKQGAAKVTIKVSDGQKVKKKVYSIKVKKRGMVYPSFSMMKGEHLDLQFSLPDVDAMWESKNPAIAEVSAKGKVIARKKGSTRLIAETDDGKKYRCDLDVTKRLDSVIYLTFDDGPNRYSTTKVLDILKKNHVKATFFELKPAVKDFDLTKRVLEEGHTLALHGYQHKYEIVYRSQKIYHDNLDKLRNLFFQKFGVWCTVSRFPGGSSNTRSRYNPGIMTKLTGKIHGWGYHYFDWNVDSGDAGGARTAKDTYQNFKNGILKGRSNVVLMHDYYKNDKTIDALDKMIQYGKKQGFTFLPITASTDEIHHGVNN